MAMRLVSSVTVGAGGAASIKYTGIAATGKDLLLVVSGRLDSGGLFQAIGTQFNNDTGSNYTQRRLSGDGTTSSSSNQVLTTGIYQTSFNGSTSTASTFTSFQMYIPNYTSTTNKSISIDNVTENNATESYQQVQAASYATSSAISSIKVFGTSNWLQYTTASLYIIS
jgi:hypothetical protein